MIRQIFTAIYAILAGFCLVGGTTAQQISAPEPQPGTITGTVLDINGGIVPGATVVLEVRGAGEHPTVTADDHGAFRFTDVAVAKKLHIKVTANGFADWTSHSITLKPGQYFILTDIHLRPATVHFSVTAISEEQLAIQQVRIQETQRILGIIPNFYVNFDSNPVPMTPRLKFRLAGKALTDPVSLAGFAVNAAIYQAAGWPSYRGGVVGYGQRLGATFAGGYAHVLVGNALLPSLLHQDPRYFYQGTGSKRSRFLHALSCAFLTYGDNGRRQVNFSGIGGDLVAGALANAYYPPKNRSLGLVFRGTILGTGGRMAFALAQEFLLNRHPPQRARLATDEE